ncbi:U2 small nuclear ribonucleoprotein A' [Lasiodiplodia hormozganensis]|uniref:U2 small nuclear ribonucleoprotein A n=1 Tax=Lasiodiplodia hormozganensis TaxID=869390 RepID=A0AA39YVT0_9PEZI|nr:U2 small nuclear ribonucleoprotein A' [Lasiodiplodia hormozganensis]
MARDYLLGNDDRPSLFLSITLWLEGHDSARLGTYSLWRSRVLPGQPGPVGGFYGNGTEYAPECIVRNERFTTPGGNADAGDGEIFFSFADLAPRGPGRDDPVPGGASTGANDVAAGMAHVKLTDAERANIEEQIKTADTLDDITRLEKLLNEGKILPSGTQA